MNASDFFDDAVTAGYADDPYPRLAGIRRSAAVRTKTGVWLAGRYADVAAGLRDPRLSCDLARGDGYAEYFRSRGIDDRFPLPLNALDPPDHPRIRTAVSAEFLPAAVERMRPAIAEAARTAVDRLAARAPGVVDLVADLAYPLPISLIGTLFGIPEEDWPLLERWSRAFGAVSDPDWLLTEEARSAGAEATRECGEYFGRLVRHRRRGGDDLLSRWVAAMRADRRMSLPELLVNGVFLLMVGHHNTVSLIANGMLALLRAPEQLAQLRADPSLVDVAVDELLRFDSPVQTATRVTACDYPIGETVIPEGATVMLLLGAANRDPERYPDPDELRFDRGSGKAHLGFGRGAHACVGGLLARVETAAALRELITRFPVLEQAGREERRVPSFSLRGLEKLPLRIA
ncbi:MULTISPECIES: cytochrome P450 [Amycolatopsis]|uniref:Cytochrome P450 n=2 Tax=Amycolatopsis TaxID=1813 RepID=A0ABW5I4U5_9PSEU